MSAPDGRAVAGLLYGREAQSDKHVTCYMCEGMGTHIVRGELRKCRVCAGTGTLKS